MEKVFGVPANILAIFMSSILIAITLVILFGAARRFILVKMGTRNIPRRKGQSTLIIIGLMLSSVIISTSLGLGDTVRYSVRSVALDFLGNTDEVIKGPGQQIFGEEYFDYSEFSKLEDLVDQNNDIDALLPVINIRLPAINNSLDLAESSMRVRGVDQNYADKFDSLVSISESALSINSLNEEQVFINEVAQKVLSLNKGDQIGIFSPSGEINFSVADIVKNGGLAGGGGRPFILLKLSTLQNLLDKKDKITEIYVSNKGSGNKALQLSEDVTKFLRSNLTNKQTAKEVFNLLSQKNIPSLIKEEAKDIESRDKETFETLIEISNDLESNNFNEDFLTNITDYQLQLLILGVLDKSDLQEEAMNLLILSSNLVTLRVDDEKSDSVKLAETVASGVTNIFTIFGSFSIMVGMLLIFLVFVLLAAARSTELGMARAVGLKRRDLIQLFTYEGTVYSLLAAVVGTSIGVGLSFGLVFILRNLIDTNNFTITPHFSLVSLLIAFSSGLILTFFTVVFSAYRTSNLNIVVAIRGLKEEFVQKVPESFSTRIINFFWDLIFPVKQVYKILMIPNEKIMNFIILLLFPVTWPLNFVRSIFKVFGKHSYIILGLLALFLLVSGLQSETYASFFIGSTGLILSIALFIRFLLSKYLSNSETVNQISGTLEGGSVLLLNSLPFDFFETWTGELTQPGPWFWPLGGAISTVAAVWLLMSNSRVLIFLLNLVLGRFSGLKAVTKTAISYPMAAKFRTGLTVAMFALIIFTLMIFSILNGISDIATDQPERVTGGYDIKASVSSDLPIEGDIRNYINMDEYVIVAGTSKISVEVKENEGENNTFKSSRLIPAEKEFLNSTKWRMAHYDPKFGTSDKEIWEALIDNPELVVANASILPEENAFGGPPDRSFKTSLLSDEDPKEMNAFTIEMKKRKSSSDPELLTVIGIVERIASGQGFGNSGSTFYSNDELGLKIAEEVIPFDTYYFSLNNPEKSATNAQKLEKTFLQNGMNAESVMDNLKESRETQNAFNRLFQGFSGLGLVVGVAAIGVLTVRAVVERRQSIGVLRAIGFKSSMIRTQFLIESSFVTLLGVVVGIFLGILQSWQIFSEISKSIEGAKFVIPLGEVGFLVGIAVIASILASVIPANEASKIYPAEALRHE